MHEIINYLEQPPGYQPGFYSLESYDDYAAIPALRSSDLKNLRRSPAHFKAAVTHPKPVSPLLEKAFAKGKAFDTLVLHGLQAFEQTVTIEPDLNKNTKAYRQWRAENNGAGCILSAAEKQDILNMVEAAMRKERFSEIFGAPGIPHRVIVWQCPDTELWCKAEIDWITADNAVVDLKSTADAGFWFFQRNAARLGYHGQAAFYLSGLTALTGYPHNEFFFAAVEVDRPYESHVFRVSDEQVQRAMYYNEENMQTLKTCLQTDTWPGYQDDIIDLDSGHYIYETYETEETLYGY